MQDGLQQRVEIIEETYEFMLAYAAQGLSGDEAGGSGAQLRNALHRCHAALTDLPAMLRARVEAQSLAPAQHYHAFIDIVAQDVQKSRAALQLVLAQPAISSQLIDNLNAWIHLRALLTDLFLIDEVLQHR